MRIGIDLGGTKIEGILLDDHGHECSRLRTPTPKGDYTATVRAIADLVRHLSTGCETPPSVGVGIPGAISPTSGLVKNANSVWLIGKPLDKDLETVIGRPVRITNDANCFAVSEAQDGAGQGSKVVFGVILGTGVGAGIAVNGHALGGHNAIAGEWGHNPLAWPQILDGHDERPGPKCYCGQSGCVETFLSGPGLSRDHQLHTHHVTSGEAIAAQALKGDPAAIATLTRFEHRLARALATVINVLDPNIIVLGGGLSNIKQLYTNVPKIWHSWIFSDTCQTQLTQNLHGDSSGVRGAAWLWD